jgi:hypothetical protein
VSFYHPIVHRSPLGLETILDGRIDNKAIMSIAFSYVYDLDVGAAELSEGEYHCL